jgi:PII-like signaling protein
MYSGMQTIKAFQYEENVTSKDVIINLGESCPIQIEYMDHVLKIYPLSEEVDEVIFTDCTLTIGVL